MPKHIRGKLQEAKTRRGLKKLRELGIVKRVDLRKSPTRAQKRTLAKYADVLSGKAKILRPKNPKSYREIFRVVGGNVIVPKRKGERVMTDKAGRIVRRRKIGKLKTTGTMKRADKIKRPAKGARIVYALPVGTGDGVKWFRFKTYQELQAFLSEFSKPYKNPDQYVVEETLQPGERINPRKRASDDDEDGEINPRDAKLDKILEGRLKFKRETRERTAAFSIIGEDLI